jgi:hypothetical protein
MHFFRNAHTVSTPRKPVFCPSEGGFGANRPKAAKSGWPPLRRKPPFGGGFRGVGGWFFGTVALLFPEGPIVLVRYAPQAVSASDPDCRLPRHPPTPRVPLLPVLS